MHLAAYTNMRVGGKCGRALQLKIHHDKWRIPACCKMQILADITKDTIQNDIPFLCGSVYADKPLIFIFKHKCRGLPVAINAVNSMYYFIQITHPS